MFSRRIEPLEFDATGPAYYQSSMTVELATSPFDSISTIPNCIAVNLEPSTKNTISIGLLLFGGLIMASLIQRLIRPFTTSTMYFAGDAPAPAMSIPEGAQTATVAAGCFWGIEHMYRKDFGSGKGLLDARVGYIGGNTDNPSYRAVCSGNTGRE